VLHQIINRNTKQDIATLFVCDLDILPRGDHSSMIDGYDDFHAVLQTLTDGRVHVWDGASVKEIHYERVYDIRPDRRKFCKGDTIDVSGLQIMETDHAGDVLPRHSTSVRFSYKKWWEQPKEEPFTGGFNQGGYTDFGQTWEEFFKDNFYDRFRQRYQERMDEQFFYGRYQQTATRPNSSSDYDTLGVSPSASNDDIKKAWKKLLVKHHPDKNPDNVEAATKRTQEINQAFDRIRRQRNIK
jgi:hypothetical protein